MPNFNANLVFSSFAYLLLFFGAGKFNNSLHCLGFQVGEVGWWLVALGFAVSAVQYLYPEFGTCPNYSGTIYDFGKKVSPYI